MSWLLSSLDATRPAPATLGAMTLACASPEMPRSPLTTFALPAASLIGSAEAATSRIIDDARLLPLRYGYGITATETWNGWIAYGHW